MKNRLSNNSINITSIYYNTIIRYNITKKFDFIIEKGILIKLNV